MDTDVPPLTPDEATDALNSPLFPSNPTSLVPLTVAAEILGRDSTDPLLSSGVELDEFGQSWVSAIWLATTLLECGGVAIVPDPEPAPALELATDDPDFTPPRRRPATAIDREVDALMDASLGERAAYTLAERRAGETYGTIGRRLDCTAERALQITVAAIRRLAKHACPQCDAYAWAEVPDSIIPRDLRALHCLCCGWSTEKGAATALRPAR